ncbi:M20/M25/M40 family metallo-hydrolase [Planococcus sp. YIM B11945]|uniref:M20/M25/M40 family metallo-hydrolase n=1 Tax=Planococcus sp. YIM B11945 TaxID=3435410 RepID=UPI003D7E41B9
MNLFIKELHDHIEQNQSSYLASLTEFLKIKSISTKNMGMEDCALFLKNFMEEIGISTKMLKEEGAFPAVYGEVANPDAVKTLLIYGHYDVQPEDPIELWDSLPFEPEIRDGKVFARGATDDKGNLWATIVAVKVLLELQKTSSVNLKFFFEGEEEIGSPNLEAYMKNNKELLKADFTILCDRGIHESGRPQIYLGNKGITNAEISLTTAKRDTHSGQAPLLPNAAWELVWLLNKLKETDLEIMVPSYYDDVMGPSEADLELIESIPFDEQEYLEAYGIQKINGTGEAFDKVKTLTQLLYEPTMTINGLTSGYQEQGNKTVIPRKASAKLDFRFVKNQNPEKCVEQIKSHLSTLTGAAIEVSFGDTRNPSKVDPREHGVLKSIKAAASVYGKEPVVWPLLDGSGPMSLFEEILGAPAIIIGLGSPFAYANTHAPNENIGIDNYLNGIAMMAYLYSIYGEENGYDA